MSYGSLYEESKDTTPISLENVKDIIHPLGVYVLYSGNIPHYFNTSELNTWINTNQTNPLTREPISDQIKNRINRYNLILENTPELNQPGKCVHYQELFLNDISNISPSHPNYDYFQACVNPEFFMNICESNGINDRTSAKQALTDISGSWLVRKSSLRTDSDDNNNYPFALSMNLNGRIIHSAFIRRRGLGYYAIVRASSNQKIDENIDQNFKAFTFLELILSYSEQLPLKNFVCTSHQSKGRKYKISYSS